MAIAGSDTLRMMARRWVSVVTVVVVACATPQTPEAPAKPEAVVERAVSAAKPVMAPPTTAPSWPGFDTTTMDSTLVVTGGNIAIYHSPGADVPAMTLPATTILGTPTVLAVVDQPEEGWVEVMLPMRPNGSTGYVPMDEVEVFLVDGEIVIDLGDRELIYYQDGMEMLRTQVAVGRPAYPTPIGLFFVTDTVTVSDPTGPWGPHALGLSARSDTITEYNGGDGIIGIHGTNNPSSIGKAESLGCIRLSNEMITRLHSMVPIGTPVEIRA